MRGTMRASKMWRISLGTPGMKNMRQPSSLTRSRGAVPCSLSRMAACLREIGLLHVVGRQHAAIPSGQPLQLCDRFGGRGRRAPPCFGDRLGGQIIRGRAEPAVDTTT